MAEDFSKSILGLVLVFVGVVAAMVDWYPYSMWAIGSSAIVAVLAFWATAGLKWREAKIKNDKLLADRERLRAIRLRDLAMAQDVAYRSGEHYYGLYGEHPPHSGMDVFAKYWVDQPEWLPTIHDGPCTERCAPQKA